MSKFSKLKNVFEKEKVKTKIKKKNQNFKTSAVKGNIFVLKQEPPPNNLHHQNIKEVSNGEKILLVEKVGPQDDARSRSTLIVERGQTEASVGGGDVPTMSESTTSKVTKPVTLKVTKVTTTKKLPHQPPLTQPPAYIQPPPPPPSNHTARNNHSPIQPTTTTNTNSTPLTTNNQPSQVPPTTTTTTNHQYPTSTTPNLHPCPGDYMKWFPSNLCES